MYKEFSKVYDEFMEYADYDLWYETVKGMIEGTEVKGNKLLDLGCGTGEVLLRACKDYRCTGADLSAEMILRAKEKLDGKGIDIPLYEQDMTQLKLDGKYDVIISMFDTVNHLTTLEDLNLLFKGIEKHLEEGGVYIFDVVDREFMDEMFPGGVFLDERENMTIIWEHEYSEEDGLDYIDTTFFVKNESGSYDKYTEDYEKRLFTYSEIDEATKTNGLSVRLVYENSELAGRRYFYLIEKTHK